MTPQERVELDSLIASTSSDEHHPAGREDVAWLPDDPVGWIEQEFWIPETKSPIALIGYQRAVLRKALTRVDDLFPYSLVLWSDVKKSAKSSIAGAVALWMAWHHEWETVRIVANDLKQAESRTFFYIKRAIELNPKLKAQCKVSGYKITLPNHTLIEAIPIDPGGEAGGGDLFLCWTELWAAKHKAAQQMWSETSLSPLKFGKSLRWAESYAGFIGESPILENLYANAVQNGHPVRLEDPDAPDDLELTESGRTLALWNTKRYRCPWQTAEFYAQSEQEYTPNELLRHHDNQWVSSVESFVPQEWWDACQGELPPLPQYHSLVVGLDAATSNDCFGIVTLYRVGELVIPLYTRKWTPPQGGKLEFSNPHDPNDETTPEGYIRWLARTYNVVEFAYDPYQLHDLCSRLRREGIGHFKEFTQGEPRLKADKQLYDLIKERRILHDGNPDLREHVLNANRVQNTGDKDKMRIVKRDERMKIDLAVALSMSAFEIMRLNLG